MNLAIFDEYARENAVCQHHNLCWLLGISVPKKRANIDSLFFVIYHQMTGDEITRNLFPCLGTDLATHQSDRSCSTTTLIFR
jgi:hypothetical protein